MLITNLNSLILQYQHVYSPYSSQIFHMLHVGRICVNDNYSSDPW